MIPPSSDILLGVLGSYFAYYELLASLNPFTTVGHPVAIYRLPLSHFWANVIFTIPTSHFQAPSHKDFFPQNPENLRPNSSNSSENAKPLFPIIVNPVVEMPPHPGTHTHWPIIRKNSAHPLRELHPLTNGVEKGVKQKRIPGKELQL